MQPLNKKIATNLEFKNIDIRTIFVEATETAVLLWLTRTPKVNSDSISPGIEVFQKDSIQLDEEFQDLKLNFPRLKELTWNGPNIIGKADNLEVNYLF